MAVPAAFADTAGLALMRGNPATGEYFFVDWLTGATDFITDNPGPGTWVYAVWLVIGSQIGANVPVTSAKYTGKGTLLVQQMKR